MASRVLTILLADLKGFTPRAASSSRQEVSELLKSYRGIITPVIQRYGGHIVKELGDAFLVTFESPTNAVAAGTLLQRLLLGRNKEVPEERRIEVRVAIHSGEVEETANDVIGDAVNVASRVESVTEVGEVYFTEAVFLTMNRSEVPSSEVGQRMLKGLPAPIKLYRVLQDPADERYLKLLASGPRVDAQARPRSRAALVAGVLVLLAAAAVVAFLLLRGDAAVREARALVEIGRHAEAVEALGRAFDKRVPPPEALGLVEQTAGQAIGKRLAKNDFAAARELSEKWSKRWPSLASLRELSLHVTLAESGHLRADGQPRAAVNVLLAARKKGVEDWRLCLALSRLYADVKLPVNPRVSIRSGIYGESVDEVAEAVRLYPAGEPLPAELEEEVWKRFAAQPRESGRYTESRARKLCALVHKRLWPKYRQKLIAGAAAEQHPLRLSSYQVLEKAGAAGKVDMLAYYAGNLTFRNSSKKRDAALAWLSSRQTPAERARALKALKKAEAKLTASRYATDRKMLAKIRGAIKEIEGAKTETF